jgi:hypothetical protein
MNTFAATTSVMLAKSTPIAARLPVFGHHLDFNLRFGARDALPRFHYDCCWRPDSVFGGCATPEELAAVQKKRQERLTQTGTNIIRPDSSSMRTATVTATRTPKTRCSTTYAPPLCNPCSP